MEKGKYIPTKISDLFFGPPKGIVNEYWPNLKDEKLGDVAECDFSIRTLFHATEDKEVSKADREDLIRILTEDKNKDYKERRFPNIPIHNGRYYIDGDKLHVRMTVLERAQMLQRRSLVASGRYEYAVPHEPMYALESGCPQFESELLCKVVGLAKLEPGREGTMANMQMINISRAFRMTALLFLMLFPYPILVDYGVVNELSGFGSFLMMIASILYLLYFWLPGLIPYIRVISDTEKKLFLPQVHPAVTKYLELERARRKKHEERSKELINLFNSGNFDAYHAKHRQFSEEDEKERVSMEAKG